MAEGRIIVKTSTSGMLIPVEDAKVFIIRKTEGKDNIIASRSTGRSGITDSIIVSAPDKINSQSPDGGRAYASVDIRVEHPLYYTLYIKDAQVFADTESVQRAELIPLAIPSGDKTKNIVITPQNV